MIRTKEIEMSQGKYFQILTRLRFSKSWKVYLLPFVLAVVSYLFLPEYDMVYKFLLVYGLVNPLWILIYLYGYSTSNKVGNIIIKRYFEIDQDTIKAVHKDGSESITNIEDVVAVKEYKDEMLVYFSAQAFIYIPYEAFEGDDLATFKNWLKKS